MELSVLKAKIHRAVVTGADLHYVGSITIDQDLMDAAGLLSYEKVLVADIDNGNVFAVMVDAVRHCSLQQISTTLYEVGGQYRRSM